VFGSGPEGQVLYFLLALSKTNLDTRCYVAKKPGYKLVLSVPGEIPQVSKYYLDILTLETVSVLVKPTLVTTSEGLRSILPNRLETFYFCYEKLKSKANFSLLGGNVFSILSVNYVS